MINITEGYPENPDTIIIKNEFYPNGLTEKEIYDYYMKNKSKLLRELKNREVIFFIIPDVNKPIVKRKSHSNFFKIDKKNYNNIITGRTISIHSTMKKVENFGIIDIDVDDFEKSKDITLEVYNYIKNMFNASIRFTGKRSFHIICEFGRNKRIDDIRKKLQKILKDFNKYTVGFRNVDLDLSPNKFKGGFITLHSLSTIGLRCMKVEENELLSFKKSKAVL